MVMIKGSSILPELTEQELAEAEAAEKLPLTYDRDCPEMTAEMLM